MNPYIAVMIFSVMVASVSQLLLKKSADRHHLSIFWEYLNPYTMTAYFLLLCSTLLTIAAFRGLDYKNGPVIESLGYLFVLILGRVFNHEKISRRKLVGNFVIIAGIIIFYC